MKKVILTMIALAAAVTAFAQFPKGLSVGAGYGMGSKTYSSPGVDQTIDMVGFYGGLSYNLAIGQSGLGIQPGLYVHMETGDVSDLGLADVDLKETSIDIPVLVNYAIPVMDILKVTPYVGPTFMYNLTAKFESKDYEQDLYKDGPGYESFYKHPNLFVGGGVALDIADIIRVSVGYDLGLLDRSSDSDNSIKENRLHFGVSFLF